MNGNRKDYKFSTINCAKNIQKQKKQTNKRKLKLVYSKTLAELKTYKHHKQKLINSLNHSGSPAEEFYFESFKSTLSQN